VLILNDGLHAIEADLPNWWAQISRCASSIGTRNGPVTVSAGSFANPTQVLTVEHADVTSVIATGGNCGTVLSKVFGGKHHERDHIIKLLRQVVDDYGYRMVKKQPGAK